MNMRFGTWNVRRLYTTGSLKTVSSELAKYNLNLMAVQGVTWVKGDSQSTEDYGSANASYQLGTGFVAQQGIRSSAERVTYVSDTVSYIILRGPWYDILNAHAKDSFFKRN
jgi:hypothetical protein